MTTTLDTTDYVTLPDGAFAELWRDVDMTDGLAVVAIDHRGLTTVTAVAATDLTPAPADTTRCEDCTTIFDLADEGHDCRNHGRRCADCCDVRPCREGCDG